MTSRAESSGRLGNDAEQAIRITKNRLASAPKRASSGGFASVRVELRELNLGAAIKHIQSESFLLGGDVACELGIGRPIIGADRSRQCADSEGRATLLSVLRD